MFRQNTDNHILREDLWKGAKGIDVATFDDETDRFTGMYIKKLHTGVLYPTRYLFDIIGIHLVLLLRSLDQ